MEKKENKKFLGHIFEKLLERGEGKGFIQF